MSLSWTHQIAKALAGGRPTLALELHLDALLVWLSNPDNPRVAELERAIGQRLTRDQAGASAYRLLDRQLFADEAPPSPATLGFVPGTAATHAKQRYRRLMQVYHPDRHPERTAWATRRTEQINRAFAAFQRGETGTAHAGTRKGRGCREAAKPSDRRLPPVWLPPALRDPIAPAWVWIHDRWAALTPLQQRLMNMAAIAGALMITIALWPEEPPRPVPRIIHHPLGIEPTPALVDEPAPESEPPPKIAPSLAATTPVPKMEVSRPAIIPPTSAPDESPSPTPMVASQGNALLDRESSVVPETSERERSAQERPTQAASEPKPEPTPEPKTDTETPAITESADLPAAPPPEAPSSAWSDPTTSRAPHADIPAAATPEPPKPPAPPAAPLALSTTPAVSTAMSADAPLATRCQAAPEILSRFQSAYQAGALDTLMALYSPLAKENELATWFAIRQTYAEWFRTTSARRIGFEQVQVQPIADSRRCALMAVFQVSYLDRQSRLVTQAGIIELLLEYKGADWTILRARY